MKDYECDIIRFFSVNGGCSLCRSRALYRFSEERGIDPKEILHCIEDIDRCESCYDDLLEHIEYENKLKHL